MRGVLTFVRYMYLFYNSLFKALVMLKITEFDVLLTVYSVKCGNCFLSGSFETMALSTYASFRVRQPLFLSPGVVPHISQVFLPSLVLLVCEVVKYVPHAGICRLLSMHRPDVTSTR